MSRRTAGLCPCPRRRQHAGWLRIPLNRAPVEDRSAPARAQAPVAAPVAVPTPASAAAEVKPPPGAENAGKPGYYTVKAGDTVSAIAKIHNQKQVDLVRWNALPNPNLIRSRPGAARRAAGRTLAPWRWPARLLVLAPRVRRSALRRPARPVRPGRAMPNQVLLRLPVPRALRDRLCGGAGSVCGHASRGGAGCCQQQG